MKNGREVGTITISEFYELFMLEKISGLDNFPESEDTQHTQILINSIIKGYPVQPVFVRTTTTMYAKKYTVLHGGKNINTLISYIDSGQVNGLGDEDKDLFWHYKLVVEYITVADEELPELLRRYNQ